jgi:D-proline reductase (dithiol) PrdB
VLSHVLERAGIATVGISLVRQQAVNARPPRILHCEFPLGRPLGEPGDPVFQRDVIDRAFALLARTDVPVLVDHPVVIEALTEPPDRCPIPPRHDPDLHPAIDEARGLRGAYDRNIAERGRTAMGRVGGPDEIDALLEVLIDVEAGSEPADLGYDDDRLVALGQDVRAYYEEAAMQLADTTGARRLETWVYQETETGRLVRSARDRLRADESHKLAATYIAPLSQR